MKDSEILILGANGQLGRALKARFPNAATANSDLLDISDRSAVDSFDWKNISVILNAAAYTNVDGAETARGRITAWKANAVGPANLARVAAEHDITLVHISSDYVFDGTVSPHTEEESFSPLGVYGQTKAAGDIAVGLAPKHYILRTSWVIGDGKNFVRTMAGLAEKGISPSVVSDQIGRLTFTSTLVDAIDHLLRTNATYGTYNVSNDGTPASWAVITRTIFAELDRSDLSVTDVTTEAYFEGKPGIAPRPLLSIFDLQKIKNIGLFLRPWQDDLTDYVQKELPQ